MFHCMMMPLTSTPVPFSNLFAGAIRSDLPWLPDKLLQDEP
jgi:hypothetical protein